MGCFLSLDEADHTASLLVNQFRQNLAPGLDLLSRYSIRSCSAWMTAPALLFEGDRAVFKSDTALSGSFYFFIRDVGSSLSALELETGPDRRKRRSHKAVEPQPDDDGGCDRVVLFKRKTGATRLLVLLNRN
jgi:hypothetical protein